MSDTQITRKVGGCLARIINNSKESHCSNYIFYWGEGKKKQKDAHVNMYKNYHEGV